MQISTLITSTVKFEPNYALNDNCCSPVALVMVRGGVKLFGHPTNESFGDGFLKCKGQTSSPVSYE